MAHGHPDWGATAGKKTLYGSLDQAELAVRLQGIASLDRLGDVILAEDFAGGLGRWTTSVNGAGCSVGIAAQPTRIGPYSVALLTAAVASAWARATIQVAYPVASRVGFEWFTTMGEECLFHQVECEAYGGGLQLAAGLRYVPLDQDLFYKNTAGVYVLLDADEELYDGVAMFNGIKLVIDTSTGEYVRCKVNETEYDMSGIPIQSAGWGGASTLRMRLYWYGDEESDRTWYLDGVTITQNEP